MLQDITKRILDGEVSSNNGIITCVDNKFNMSIDFNLESYGMCKVGNVLEMVIQFAKHTLPFSDKLTYSEFTKCVTLSTIGSEVNIYRPDIIMINIKENVSIEKFNEFIDNGGYSLVYNQQQWVNWLNTPNMTPTIPSAKYIKDVLDNEAKNQDQEPSNIVYKNVNHLFDIEVDDNEISNLNNLVSEYMLPKTYIKIEQFYLMYAKFYGLDYSGLPCVKFLEVFDYIQTRLKNKKDEYDKEIEKATIKANSEEPNNKD